jgi:uncharacterized protein
MTPEERNILQSFLADLGAGRGAAKDAEADGLINDALRSNPDAAYMLVQHAILSDQALHAAQQRIAELESQTSVPATAAPSFLGGGQGYPQPAYAPTQPIFSNPLSSGGGLGSFLRSAGTMAAGVAAGDFLAQGIENLFGPRW